MTKVLVIDDNPDIRDLLEDNLSEAGFEVFTARDGDEGVQLFKKLRPKVVVTDITMPKKDGLEVIIDIRYDHPDTIIIAISGNYDSSQVLKAAKVFKEREEDDPEYFLDAAVELGADFILEKPFTPQELLDTISELMEKRKNREIENEDEGPKDKFEEINPPSLDRIKKSERRDK